jgi:SynChlorMet cassette protein ScmD
MGEKTGMGEALVANPVVVFREEFDDWAVLFNPDTADAAGINPVGCEIWKLLDGRHSVEEIVAAVRDRFDDVPGTAAEEISAFIDGLVERGFVGYAEGQESG